MSRRSKLALALVVAALLAPGALVAYAVPDSATKHATGIPGLPGAVGLEEEANLKNLPGDPVAGLEVFRVYCAGCHNFKAAGMQGTFKTGSDLDDRKPTYSKIVTLIAQGGGGGAPSKQLLQQLTFDQIYDVAKFVALYAGKPGPVKGATVEPPVPFEIAAPLRNASSKVAGHFTAKLAGSAFRWHIHVGNASKQPSTARLLLVSPAGKPIKTMTLDCQRCIDPGNGFVLLTPAQAAAVTKGRATVVVPGTGLPNGPLRGKIVVRRA
jgi:mono/diheme cytochrome c family protein